jgi:hypothetical protein
LLTEIGLLANAFGSAGARHFTIGRNLAAAEFRFRAVSAERAATEVGNRLPRPTAGTALALIAGVVDAHEVAPIVFTTEGWPDEIPEPPDADEAIYEWTADDPNAWEVL